MIQYDIVYRAVLRNAMVSATEIVCEVVRDAVQVSHTLTGGSPAPRREHGLTCWPSLRELNLSSILESGQAYTQITNLSQKPLLMRMR